MLQRSGLIPGDLQVLSQPHIPGALYFSQLISSQAPGKSSLAIHLCTLKQNCYQLSWDRDMLNDSKAFAIITFGVKGSGGMHEQLNVALIGQ